MTSETGRSGYHHGDLRAALVTEALALIEERGVEGLSLREVARRAGVSRAAPYHHFKNKEAMAAAVAESGFRELARCMDAIDDLGDPNAELEACGRAYLAFALKNPTLYRLMFGTKIEAMSDHPELQDAARDSFGRLEGRLARMGGSWSDAQAIAMAIWASMHGMALLIIDNLGPYDTAAPANVERWTEAVMLLLGHGLEQRGSP
ncbi:MAG: TetR/AcrR family transcriptional regulator [Myxococcota bacterium]